MRIGIDIDGVIADTLPLLVAELNNFFNRNIRPRDVTSYNILDVYDIEAGKLEEFASSRKNILTEAPEPVPGAVPCLNRLKEHACLFLVSARNPELRTLTEKWLQKHGVPRDELILLGSHDKVDTCVRLGLDVLVEDSRKNALQVSARGIRVLLLDAPYNRGALPPLVKRCLSWDEICAHLY